MVDVTSTLPSASPEFGLSIFAVTPAWRAASATACGPTSFPSAVNTTLFDSVMAFFSEQLLQSAPSTLRTVLPGPCWPSHWVLMPIGGLCCRAASMTNGLKVDPACFFTCA